MSEKREFTCICCPLGCQITVKKDGDEISVTGNNCIRGDKYVRDELTHPVRMVTSMVAVEGGELPVVSVKTKEAIPKEKMAECIEALKNMRVKAPVKIGDVILENVAGTGIPIIATKNITKHINCR